LMPRRARHLKRRRCSRALRDAADIGLGACASGEKRARFSTQVLQGCMCHADISSERAAAVEGTYVTSNMTRAWPTAQASIVLECSCRCEINPLHPLSSLFVPSRHLSVNSQSPYHLLSTPTCKQVVAFPVRDHASLPIRVVIGRMAFAAWEDRADLRMIQQFLRNSGPHLADTGSREHADLVRPVDLRTPQIPLKNNRSSASRSFLPS